MMRQFLGKRLIGFAIFAFFLMGAISLAQAQAKKEPTAKAAPAQKGPTHIGVIDGYSGMAAIHDDDKIKACRMYVDRVKAKEAFWREN